tara:strand:- start:6617 stop:7621 length:1005 start_codon:yes stop_codon:yes gene_type:complete
MRLPLISFLLFGLVACGSVEPAPVRVSVRMTDVPVRYQAQLRALQDSVGEHENEAAEHIVRSVSARLEAEELVGAEDIDGVQQLLDGFHRILRGRRLLSELDLRLELEPVDGAASMRVWLRGDSSGALPVTVRPGGATLRIERLFANPSGEMAYSMRQAFFADLTTLPLERETTFEKDLGEFPIQIGPDSIAGRTTWTLDLTAGFVEQDGVRYPAQDTRIAFIDRIELATDLPNAPLVPEELAEAVLNPSVGMSGVMERCVRIHPREYDAALVQLAPLVSRATDDEISMRLAPCLRWLSRGRASGSDPTSLRRWVANWSRHHGTARKAAGGLDI